MDYEKPGVRKAWGTKRRVRNAWLRKGYGTKHLAPIENRAVDILLGLIELSSQGVTAEVLRAKKIENRRFCSNASG